MDKVVIFGHKNPDTDSLCSALAYADLKTQLGMSVEALRLGDINPETEFALKHFQVEAPRLVSAVADEAKDVILVDHNERQQSASDIQAVRVTEVIDHHRIANFETSQPLYYRAEPVGCTATILRKMYLENGLSIPQSIAGLMLSAIISDTLLLKSPTCTEEDVKAVQALAQIAAVNYEEYGLQMLKAGADLRDKTALEIISLDAKEFPMGTYKVEIAQVNTVDTNDVMVKQDELENAIAKVIADKGLDLFVLVVTDILNSNSTVLVLGRVRHAVEQAYHVTLNNNTALLRGVVSRKKQVVPILTETLEKFHR